MRTLIFVLAAAWAWPAHAAVPLEDGFRNPPREARLRCYWWWLNSHVTKQSITRDLTEMKAKHYGGAIIVDAGGAEQRGNDRVPAGPVFGSPEWRALYRHAIAEASRLNLELSLNILSGWNLGGPPVKPETAAKQATWSQTQVTGPAHVERVLPAPASKLGYYRDVAVLAYPLRHGAKPSHKPIRQLDLKAIFRETGMSHPDSRPLLTDFPAEEGEQDTSSRDVLDISAKMAPDGRLVWDAPAGEWEVLRFGYTCTGARVSTFSDGWDGLAIDYLDPAAFQAYWREVVAPLIRDAGPEAGKTLKYLVTDSWELGGINWTPHFREEFRKRRGYEITPWLPVYAGRLVDSRDASNRFLNDLRRTVADLVADHYRLFASMAARHSLGIHPESGGPHGAPVDALLNLGISAFPQMEFWANSKTHRVKDEDRFFIKQCSSAAHIYGKTFCAAEGFTTIGPQWEESIWDNLKPNFDRAVCEGLNLLVWHGFVSSPKEMGLPGQEYFAGTHFNPNVTWWNQSAGFLGYINRVQFLMQQGHFVADALYYYGDHIPNFVRLKTEDPARVLPGYDYDACDLETLLNRVSVKDGRLVLPDGMSYALLVLPELENISPLALAKVRALVNAGATVTGPRPKRATGLEGDGEVVRLAAELWDSGRVLQGRTAREVLAGKGVPPDFEGAGLDYIHRRTGEADIYFVSSQSDRGVSVKAIFRVGGKAPELWDPATGNIRPLAVYEATAGGRTTVPITLEPYGSAMVVFRKPAGAHFVSIGGPAEAALAPLAGGFGLEAREAGEYTLTALGGRSVRVNVPRGPEPLLIEGPWTVHFAPGWGAPESVLFGRLESWTENSDPAIKHFSGTAAYVKDVEIPADYLRGGRLELALGDVREIAQVLVNGRDLGLVWKLPRTVDLGAAVKPGKNRLEIRVTNLWPNRLIGDQLLPESQRRTHTNIRKFTKDSPLMPSGLLGPVTLRYVAQTPVTVQ